MANFNKVIFLGRLTRDPEMKYTQGGTGICKFGMVSNRKSGKGDDKKEESCFADVTAFGKTGDVISQYCQKGSALLVEGRLQYSAWEKDGKKNHKLEIVADTVQLMSGGERKKKVGGGESGERVSMFDDKKDDIDLDQVPF